MAQESLDDLSEEKPSARFTTDQFVERSRDRPEVRRQLLFTEVHVQSDSDDGVGFGRKDDLDEDPGELAALMEKIVGPLCLETVSRSEDGLDRRSDDPGGEMREARPEVPFPSEGQRQRKEQIASGRRLPPVSSAAPAPGLEFGRDEIVGGDPSRAGPRKEVVVGRSGFLEMAEAVDWKAREVRLRPTPDDLGMDSFDHLSVNQRKSAVPIVIRAPRDPDRDQWPAPSASVPPRR